MPFHDQAVSSCSPLQFPVFGDIAVGLQQYFNSYEPIFVYALFNGVAWSLQGVHALKKFLLLDSPVFGDYKLSLPSVMSRWFLLPANSVAATVVSTFVRMHIGSF